MAEVKTGCLNVAVVGTAVQGPATPTAQNARFTIVAHPDNTGAIFVGNDGSTGAGDVSSTSGVALDPGDQLSVNVPQLSDLWFDTESTGNDACWFYHG